MDRLTFLRDPKLKKILNTIIIEKQTTWFAIKDSTQFDEAQLNKCLSELYKHEILLKDDNEAIKLQNKR